MTVKRAADDRLRRQQVRAVHRRPTAGPSVLSPAGRVQRLQSLAGNRATVGVLQRAGGASAPQTQDDDLQEGVERIGGAVDTLAGTGATFGSYGGLVGGQYLSGNSNTPTADAGSGLGVLGFMTGGVSVVTSSMTVDSSRKDLVEEIKAGRGREAKARGAKRDLKSGVANLTQGVLTTASQPLNVASGISQHLANAGSSTAFASANNLMGGIGGAIALPVSLASSVRMGRKTVKQYSRFRKLRKGVEDPETSASEAKKALDRQKEAVAALEQNLQAAVDELEEARQGLAAARRGRGDLQGSLQTVLERQNIVSGLQDLLDRARAEERAAEQARADAEAALNDHHQRAARGEESPADIRAYAMAKNNAGWKKKLVGTVAGFIGVGGGMAATLAAFAAAGLAAVVTVAAATPVGWALCGAAAVAGLAMAGYAFWKWASKRYQRLVEGGAQRGFSTFLKSINPFAKGIPDSRRQKLAGRLYELANGTAPGATPADTTEARNLIGDLGLSWDSLRMKDHKEASVKLIYAKMAS